MTIKSKFKKELQKALSDDERSVLFSLVTLEHGPPRDAPRHSFNNVDATIVCRLLHQGLFGTRESGERAQQKILENLDGIKDFLLRSKSKVEAKEASRALWYPMPEGLRAHNKDTGEIPVTIHAWERFCERFCPPTHSLDKVMADLKDSFQRAAPKELKHRWRAIDRIVNNNGEPTLYFFDSKLGCRFVVVKKAADWFQGAGWYIVTAEIPEVDWK